MARGREGGRGAVPPRGPGETKVAKTLAVEGPEPTAEESDAGDPTVDVFRATWPNHVPDLRCRIPIEIL